MGRLINDGFLDTRVQYAFTRTGPQVRLVGADGETIRGGLSLEFGSAVELRENGPHLVVSELDQHRGVNGRPGSAGQLLIHLGLASSSTIKAESVGTIAVSS